MNSLDQAIKEATDQYNSDLLFGRQESAGNWLRYLYSLLELREAGIEGVSA